MLAAMASSPLAVEASSLGASPSATAEPPLRLPPSKLRPWRLPGLPAEGAVVRVFECQYAHLKLFFDGIQGLAPGQNHTSADSRMPRLHSCVSDEMSRWYHAAPASLVRPSADSLWFSYTNVLQAHGRPQDVRPKEDFPSSRVMGFLLDPATIRVDAAFPHDAWSTQGQTDYSLCQEMEDYSSEEYARWRMKELEERCESLAVVAHDKNMSAYDPYTRYHLWKTSHFSNWVRFGKQTCFHPTIAQAEADQRAYLKLLNASRTPDCEPGPLYNQLQGRYNVRQITGIFFTPELRQEAEMVRKAVQGLGSAFGQPQPLMMIEAVRTSDYPKQKRAPMRQHASAKQHAPPNHHAPTSRKLRLRAAHSTLLPASESESMTST
jgi:hypothetical protein